VLNFSNVTGGISRKQCILEKDVSDKSCMVSKATQDGGNDYLIVV